MSQSRQLAAIMFTDIVGYTRLMGNDETKAIEILKINRELQKPIIENFNGNWIKELGDGVMASFNTVSDAINAAIKIQEACNAVHEFQLRIGIHLGEVVFENGDVFGDGVNIASRIVSLAEPGGIYISGKIYAEIKNQKSIESVFLGMFDLKNVASSVELFAISNPGIAVPKKEKLQPAEKEIFVKKDSSKNKLYLIGSFIIVLLAACIFYYKSFSGGKKTITTKSIAVLPFINLSSDKNDEYFADGMCDEILTNLSKVGDLKVISRTSVMQYKNTKKNLREIAGELGVSNILEGSVQKSNDRLRINVQLINAETDEHLWAESYDRENKDVFSIQSEIAKKIAHEMNATLSENEKSLIDEKPTDNLQAYDFYLRGEKYSSDLVFNVEEEKQKIGNMDRMYRAAFRLDPNFVEAYSSLITGYLALYWNGIETNNDIYKVKAKSLLDTLLALNIDKPAVHIANGYFKYQGERDYSGALAEFEIAGTKNPNNTDVLTAKAYVNRRLGRLDEAIILFQKVNEINPNDAEFLIDISETYTMNRNADEAISELNKAIPLTPDNPYFYILKASVYIGFKNDFKTARSILDDAKSFVDPFQLTEMSIYLDVFQGNYLPAFNYFIKYPDSLTAGQAGINTNAQYLGVLYKASGKEDSAKKYFNKDRELMLSLLKKTPNDFRIYRNLGIDYAALGEKEKALENANRAGQLMPPSKDAMIGVVPIEALAVVYTYLGEQDKAIDILEKLLKLPRGFAVTATIPLYKTHPYWKLLWGNARFRKMVKGENG
jgi:adenylate cyclase